MTDLKIYRGEQPEFTRDEMREVILYGMACEKLGMDATKAVEEYFDGLVKVKDVLNTTFVNERNEH
jgi:hypothetical protein